MPSTVKFLHAQAEILSQKKNFLPPLNRMLFFILFILKFYLDPSKPSGLSAELLGQLIESIKTTQRTKRK